jgi:hypothetical protein
LFLAALADWFLAFDPFDAVVYLQPSGRLSVRIQCPHSRSAVQYRDTVGMETPSAAASNGVEYLLV